MNANEEETKNIYGVDNVVPSSSASPRQLYAAAWKNPKQGPRHIS